MKPLKKFFASTATLALSIFTLNASAQSPYPCPHVKLVVPYPPGGTVDLLARLLQPGLTKDLGVPIVVENKAGASSNIGTEHVASSPPDGCTLLLGNNTGIAINRNLYKLRIDPIKGLAPVGAVASVPLVLYVHSTVPVTNFNQLVEYIRKNPGKLSYASGGSGSPQHLMGELLKLEKGLHVVHIPYRGQGPATQDVLSGHIPMAFETISVITPHLSGGRVRALATTAAARSESLPDLPTMKELGMSNFVTENWYGVFAPAKTPTALVARLNAALQKTLDSEEVRTALKKLGSTNVKGSSEDFEKFIARELPVWETVVKRSGAKVD